MSSLKKQAINGMKWTSLSTGIRTVLQIIQLVILARFLNAVDFGLVAIVTVAIGFTQIFMDMGISNAIIHKQNITDIQLSSLYWLSIFSGMALTLIVFLIAPVVSVFYDEKEIIPLLQLLSITFLINSVGNQYRVLFKKELKFIVLAKIEILSGIGSFLCALTLAIKGFGAYSLVYATLVNVVISNIILLIKGLRLHRPKFVYHNQEIKSFLIFGLYQMGQNSIVYFNNQFDVILIGKLLGTEVLGIYSLTKQLVMRPAQIINPIITNITFPIMAKIQDDLNRLKSFYLNLINYLSSINFPIYILMVVLADSLVPLILGDKWVDTIVIFQVLSVYALIRSTASPAGSLLLSKGRADIGFWWSVGEFLLMPFVIYFGSDWGVLGVSIGLLIFQTLFLLPNWYFIVKKICQASFVEYFYVQLLPLLAALLSVGFVYLFVSNFEMSYDFTMGKINYTFIKIIVFTLLNAVLYLFISYWINVKFVEEMKNILLKR